MPKILYLHGYNSSGSSDSANFIRSVFNEFQVISPTYAYLDPDTAEEQLDQLFDDNEFSLVIGSSLGGFWAMLMGQRHCVPSLAVNPSVNVSENLKKYNIPGLDEAYFEFELELFKLVGDSSREPCTVILGNNDCVIQNQPIDFLLKNTKVVNTDWEHRMSKRSTDMNLLRELADELMGNTIGCQE